MINKIFFFDEQLDEVSAGQANWKNILADFWPGFHESVLGAMKIPVEKVNKKPSLNAVLLDDMGCLQKWLWFSCMPIRKLIVGHFWANRSENDKKLQETFYIKTWVPCYIFCIKHAEFIKKSEKFKEWVFQDGIGFFINCEGSGDAGRGVCEAILSIIKCRDWRQSLPKVSLATNALKIYSLIQIQKEDESKE